MQRGRGAVLSPSYQFSWRQWELECHRSCKLFCSFPISTLPPLPAWPLCPWSLLRSHPSAWPVLCSLLLESRELVLPSTFPLFFVFWLVAPQDITHWTRSHHLFRDDVALQAAAHQHQCKTHSQKIEPSCPNPLLKVKQAVILEKFLGQSEFHHNMKDMALQEMQLRTGNTAPWHSVDVKHYGILPDSYERK